jgi:hypothetical protein
LSLLPLSAEYLQAHPILAYNLGITWTLSSHATVISQHYKNPHLTYANI